MSESKPPTASALQPRGLNIIAAARYWGVSPGTFRKLVRLGIAPQTLKIPEIDRNIYDRLEIDAAISARAASHGGVA
jgi:hypothetical protein